MMLLFTLLFTKLTLACSSFCFEQGGQSYMAKNYDWHLKDGFLVSNFKNVNKENFRLPGQPKIRWKSEFSSLTFNQYGKEFPLGGINEKGLTIEVLWNDKSTFPDQTALPAFNELQWIQWGLDTAATVPELVAFAKRVEVMPLFAKIHYLACDPTNKCAVFEYLEGKLKVYPSEEVTQLVLTNSPYRESVDNLKKYVGFGGQERIPFRATDTFERFALISSRMLAPKPENAVAFGFDVLSRVEQANVKHSTRYQILYALNQKTVHFRTLPGATVYVASFNQFSKTMDCQTGGTERLIQLPIEEKLVMEDLTETVNQDILEHNVKHTAPHLSPKIVEAAAKFPFQLKCQEKRK